MPAVPPKVKPAFQTMWMFPRNIRCIEPRKLAQISKLIVVCTGDLVPQEVQDDLHLHLHLQLQELIVHSKKDHTVSATATKCAPV